MGLKVGFWPVAQEVVDHTTRSLCGALSAKWETKTVHPAARWEKSRPVQEEKAADQPRNPWDITSFSQRILIRAFW
ncbi:MAG: hypothetical protein ACRC2T_09065 [Thermoguttaceae bacterium]